MSDYTSLEFPACTESPYYLLSDCGSSTGALLLFCSWNIISMYLFANLVLAAVVENFSAVITSQEGRSALDREQLRAFKRAWAAFDHNGSGRIPAHDIAPLLSQLRGAFDTRIWPAQYSLSALRVTCRNPDDGMVDLKRLQAVLRTIDADELQVRKRKKNFLHHEALLKAHEDPKNRIAFRDLLLLVIRYCLVDDEKALSYAVA